MNELPQNRATAKKAKSVYYFTGNPCKNGHVDKRLTSNSSCVLCHNMRGKKRTYNYQKRHPFHAMFYRRKNAAKHDNIPFTIKINELSVPEMCPVLGIALKHGKDNLDTSPSLDRVDPSKGYIPGNVRVISVRANRIKSDGTIEEHQKVINYMREHHEQ